MAANGTEVGRDGDTDVPTFSSVVITNVCDRVIGEINDIVLGRKPSCCVLNEYRHIYDGLMPDTGLGSVYAILPELRRRIVDYDVERLNIETKRVEHGAQGPAICQICLDELESAVSDPTDHYRVHPMCRTCYITYGSDVCPSCRRQMPMQPSMERHNQQLEHIDRCLRRSSIGVYAN